VLGAGGAIAAMRGANFFPYANSQILMLVLPFPARIQASGSGSCDRTLGRRGMSTVAT